MEPSAVGIVNVPPLIFVPAGAVVSVSTWQVAQPILSKRPKPFFAAALLASCESRAGAFVARIKRAKRSISERPSDPGLSFGSEVLLHRLVTSLGCRRLVMPISLRYASPANDSRLAGWSFHPKRATPNCPGDCTMGT